MEKEPTLALSQIQFVELFMEADLHQVYEQQFPLYITASTGNL